MKGDPRRIQRNYYINRNLLKAEKVDKAGVVHLSKASGAKLVRSYSLDMRPIKKKKKNIRHEKFRREKPIRVILNWRRIS